MNRHAAFRTTIWPRAPRGIGRGGKVCTAFVVSAFVMGLGVAPGGAHAASASYTLTVAPEPLFGRVVGEGAANAIFCGYENRVSVSRCTTTLAAGTEAHLTAYPDNSGAQISITYASCTDNGAPCSANEVQPFVAGGYHGKKLYGASLTVPMSSNHTITIIFRDIRVCGC